MPATTLKSVSPQPAFFCSKPCGGNSSSLGEEEPEMARKRALKELTGASLDVPAKAALQEDVITAAATAAGGLREIVMIRNARPDE